MLKSVLRATLLVEVLFYIWLGGHLAQRETTTAQIAALILLIALLWRLSHALGSHLVAAWLRWRDGRALPLGNSLAAFASELRARLIIFNWSQVFPGLRSAPIPSAARMAHRSCWCMASSRIAVAGCVYVSALPLPIWGRSTRSLLSR